MGKKKKNKHKIKVNSDTGSAPLSIEEKLSREVETFFSDEKIKKRINKVLENLRAYLQDEKINLYITEFIENNKEQLKNVNIDELKNTIKNRIIYARNQYSENYLKQLFKEELRYSNKDIKEALNDALKKYENYDEAAMKNEIQRMAEEITRIFLAELEKNKHLEEIKKEYEKQKKLAEEYLDLSRRLKKDYENLKKRTDKEMQKLAEYATEQVIKDLLPVLDDFYTALKKEQNSRWENIDEIFRGFELIYAKLLSILQKHGLSIIEPVNQKFDYNLHEAVSTVERDDVEPDTIVDQISLGYKLKDKVLKPALVIVAKKKTS